MKPILLLICALALAACKTRTGAGTANSGSGSEDAMPPSAFYKRYSGTVAGKAVVMHLTKYGSNLQGVYSYVSIGRDILLRERDDTLTKDGSYCLMEEVPSGAPDKTRAFWTLRLEGNTAKGGWSRSDGTSQGAILLNEEYPAGSVKLDAFLISDSAQLRPGTIHSPVARASFGYLMPAARAVGFLDMTLRQQLVPGSSGDVGSAIKSNMAAYFSDYRSENKDLNIHPEGELGAFAFSYTNDQAVYVHANDDNWLVTELFSSLYTGGVHGSYASSFANIDLTGNRVWKLADIVADTAALRPMLNDAAIDYFGLKPGEDMDQRLLVDEVPPTDVVYVGPKGLNFVYNPYEIASYADGQVMLFVPYRKLYTLLSPAFRQRMRLSDQSGLVMVRHAHNNSFYGHRRNT